MLGTINIINKQVARELELSEDLVKRINAYYWLNGIKAEFQCGSNSAIRIKNLGTFMISRFKLNKKIRELIKEIRKISNLESDFKIRTRQEVINERKEYLKVLLERRNDIAKLYYQRELKIKLKKLNRNGNK